MKVDEGENPQLLGNILVERGTITRRQLREAVAMALASETMRLGDALVAKGVAREDVEAAYERQRLMKATKVAEKTDTAHSVIEIAEAQNARLANTLSNASDRADAVVRRFKRERRKTGGA